MGYCKIYGNKVEVAVPESVDRLVPYILGSAHKKGAFGENRGLVVDEEQGNRRYIDVVFEEETKEETILNFCKEIEAAIKALLPN